MTHGEIGLRTLDDIFDMNTSLAMDTQLLPQEYFLMPSAMLLPQEYFLMPSAMPSAMPSFPTINGSSIEGTTNSTFAASSLSLTLHEVVKRWELF